MDGSLAGVVVAQTGLAHVDGERGVALVRGYSLPELAARRRYEELAYLVLRGELPGADEAREFQEMLREHGALPPPLREVAGRLGGLMGEATALASAMGLLDHEAPRGDAGEQAQRALARVPALVAAVGERPAPDPSTPYARQALQALGATRTDAAAERALEVLLSLEVEHGLSASTFACRVAASSGARAGVSLGAAVATLTGPRHGGATADAQALLDEARQSGDTTAFVQRAHEQKRRLPGFGHRLYKVPDPRVPPLRAAMEALGEVRLLPVALELEREMAATVGKKGIFANIDLFGAVLLDALGVPASAFVAAFALGLAPGWLAHWIEQGQTGRLIRPDSAYIGPAARPLP